MRLIDRILFLGPHAIIREFEGSRVWTAALMSREQQIEEAPDVPLLPYHSDPVIVIPEAIAVRDLETGGDNLEFVDQTGNRVVPEAVLWTGGDNIVYMVGIEHCYDAETVRRVA